MRVESVSYQVLARKWRPGNFNEVVGQEHVLQALVNALDSNRLHHAYLFSGTRGVGKTTIARIFAKSLNCDTGISSRPCGICASCLEVDAGRSIDLIEIDAASRTGVDDMRELLDNVQYAPTRGRFKIYLIDEVHMLSRHSFNALLKTLEEPPEHIKFLLATTDPQKLPVTVLSRCLQFNLKRMSKQQIQSQLQYLLGEEKIESESNALGLLASAADGSMRDALSLLDQAIAYGAGSVKQQTVETMLGTISRDYLVKLLDALVRQDAAEMMRESRNIIAHNPDYARVCAEMISLLQTMAFYKSDANIEPADDMLGEQIIDLSERLSVEEIQLYYQIMLRGRHDLNISPDEAAGFEMLMLRLLAFSPDPGQAVDQPAAGKKKPVVQTLTTSEANFPGAANSEDECQPLVMDEPTRDPSASAASADSSPATRPGSNGIQRVGAQSDLESGHVEPETGEAIHWSSFAYELGLLGLAQEIAVNSTLESIQENHLRLNLTADIHKLANPVIEDEIRQAIATKLGVSLKLELHVQHSLQVETPHLYRQRQLREQRQTAIEKIRQDGIVRKLGDAFGAELDESSVRKIGDDPGNF